MHKIAITESQKKVVLEVLQRHFPKAEYFVFGSRATKKNLKPFSDLDIAIRTTEILNADLILQAQEDFSNSDLPFKVDLVDLHKISKEFLTKITSDLISLS